MIVKMCFSIFQLLYIHKGYLRLRLNFFVRLYIPTVHAKRLDFNIN
uniref:Uncharacterized protein n=1 Tax=Anguilla anguilla TaxID=7936 RepID=A0A0E9QNF6_ANGAN